MAEPVGDVASILIVRTSALGDVVHSLPVLAALRRTFPDARIAWVVEGAMAPLLEGHPDLDDLLVVRARVWRRQLFRAETWREIFAFLRRVRALAPQVALDLMGNHKSGVIARISGAPRRFGLARELRREPSSSIWINRPVTSRAVHAVDRALAITEAVGGATEAVDFSGAKLFPNASKAIGHGVKLPKNPFVLIHPGAGWGSKTYPAEAWGEVAWRLEEAVGIETRVAIAPGEEEMARRVVTSSRGAAQSVPAGDLESLTGLARAARLVLGSDTGPIHLSHALGTEVLCLMGPTDPASHGPYGAPRNSLSVRLPCSYCHKRFAEPKACLLSLSPTRVVNRALELLTTVTP